MALLIPLLHRLIRLRYHALGLRSQFLNVGDYAVHYLASPAFANRRTIFFIHGLGTSSSSWVKIIPAFIHSYTIIAIDLPGFGFSTLPPSKGYLTLAEFDRMLDHFAASVLPPSFVVVGHSLGGWIAMRFALRHPDRIEKLVLVNPAGIYYDGVQRQAELFKLQSVSDLSRLLTTMWYRYPFFFRLFHRAVYNDLKSRRVSEFVRTISRDDFINESLTSWNIPTHIIWGRNDRLISPASLRVFSERVPSAAGTFIDDCGHIPQLEKPKTLVDALAKILGKAE